MKDDVELLCVRKGCDLFWPSAIGGGRRGGAGTIVRRDDPLLNFGTMNQMHVFCGPPEGAKPSPHSNPDADRLYRSTGYKHAPEFLDSSAPADLPPTSKPRAAPPPPRPAAPPSAGTSSRDDS